MDLYLAAAYKAEEINKPENEPLSGDWVAAIKQAHRDCKAALADLNAHRKDHGC